MIYKNAYVFTCDHPACKEYAITKPPMGTEPEPPKNWITISRNGDIFCGHTIQCARVILNNMGVEAF